MTSKECLIDVPCWYMELRGQVREAYIYKNREINRTIVQGSSINEGTGDT